MRRIGGTSIVLCAFATACAGGVALPRDMAKSSGTDAATGDDGDDETGGGLTDDPPVPGSSSDGTAHPTTDTTAALDMDADGGNDDSGEAPEVLEVPGDLLDLHAWKLTLPTGADGPDEILPPELLTYVGDPCFRLVPEAPAVSFVAPIDGVTTSGSSYPRCELRELTDDGRDLAAWSTTSGRHTMTIVQSIDATPTQKPHVVAGQIHDADDDLIMIRLEDERLFVEANGDEIAPDLDSAYVLGTEFTVRIVAEDGVIEVYYDDLATARVTLERDATGCYFKAGAYPQSNEDYDAPPDVGEVSIRSLEVMHE